MGWSLGFDHSQDRYIGYGVPAYCDHPECDEEIDRGLGCVCGGQPYGGDDGCGLYFCGKHLTYDNQCPRCEAGQEPFAITKPEHPRWMRHLLYDPSWAEWRAMHPEKVRQMDEAVRAAASPRTTEVGDNG
jgi:hypothetical protein